MDNNKRGATFRINLKQLADAMDLPEGAVVTNAHSDGDWVDDYLRVYVEYPDLPPLETGYTEINPIYETWKGHRVFVDWGLPNKQKGELIVKVRCPNCNGWVNIYLPQAYKAVTVTAACPTCGHPVTVDIGVKAGPIVGPRETKAAR